MTQELTVRIIPDMNPESPRTWDQIGVMAAFHSRYLLGDEDPDKLIRRGTLHESNITIGRPEDFSGWDEWEEELRKAGAIGILPLYLYDHSVQSLSTRSFVGRAQHAEWDSGRVGFIFTTKERIRALWGDHADELLSDPDRLREILEAEVEEYDQYMRGEVYGYVIENEDGTAIDSYFGFYSLDAAREEAARTMEYLVKKELEPDMRVFR